MTGVFAPTVRLGVTGLARAGKTVFITALVHNLIAGGRLPFFRAAAEGRLIRAYLEPQPDDDVPRFAYEDHLAKLTASPPDWPESTRRVSQLRLTLEYEPTAFLSRQLGSSALHIDIVDYPGEWLLDLPLLKLNFEEWSAEAMALSRAPERAAFARDWHEFLRGVDPNAREDEQIAMQGFELFAAYLRRCRAETSLLSTVTPGRMLMPGDLEGSPALTFMPLDLPGGAHGPRGSLHAMMARRFEAYKSHVVKPFFRDHFAKLDRQIVLIDVLGAMNSGSAALADLERALAAILGCFRPGANSWLASILGRRIDRILFAATKADHIHHTSHDRLEAILQRLVQKAIDRAVFSGASVQSVALAAVRATRELEARERGGALACIAGTPLPGEVIDGQRFDGREEVALFPGDLPVLSGKAVASPLQGTALNFLRFRPPALQNDGFGANPVLPHIRLDRAMQFLFGDKLE
ncbi:MULTISPECIES: YcjX family protein [Rhodomicrobium]|uniref:YcjX family protein n=1 Tax=Rhodomicrobium TaxID=1068 RepID=UPI000B4B2482|nr:MULTISPECIES: YcjX family protein [Rhodomicrobium]